MRSSQVQESICLNDFVAFENQSPGIAACSTRIAYRSHWPANCKIRAAQSASGEQVENQLLRPKLHSPLGIREFTCSEFT